MGSFLEKVALAPLKRVFGSRVLAAGLYVAAFVAVLVSVGVGED